MFQIRQSVFETNSSSTHCIVVTADNGNAPPLDPDGESRIDVQLDEFGWGPECFNDLYRKLQYVLTLIFETEYRTELSIERKSGNLEYDRDKFYDDIFKDTFGFIQVNDIIQEYCGYGIRPIVNNVRDVYVDHQSCEYYSGLGDFLDEHNLTLEKFLFDTGVWVVISNDNGGPKVHEFNELQGKIDTVSRSCDHNNYDDYEEDEDAYEEDEDSYDDDEYSGHLSREGRFVYDDEDTEEFPDYSDYYDDEE